MVLGTLLGWWINVHFDVAGLDEAGRKAVLEDRKAWLD